MLDQTLILVSSIFPFLSSLMGVTSNVCNLVKSNLVVQYLVEHGFVLYYLVKSALFGSGIDKLIQQRSALLASIYFALHPARNWNFVSNVSTINYVSVFLLIVGVTFKLRPSSPIINVFGVITTIVGAVLYPEPVLMCVVLALVFALNIRLEAYSSKGRKDFSAIALCGGLFLVGGLLGAHDSINEVMVTTRSSQLLIIIASSFTGILHLLVNVVQVIKTQFCLHSALTYSLKSEPWLRSFMEHNRRMETTLDAMITVPSSHVSFVEELKNWSSALSFETLEAYIILLIMLLLAIGAVVTVGCSVWSLVKKGNGQRCLSSFWLNTAISYVLLCVPTALRCVELQQETKGASKVVQRSIEQRLVATWSEGAYMSAVALSIALGLLMAHYFQPAAKSGSDKESNTSGASAIPRGLAGVIWRVLPYYLLLLGLQSYLQTA